MDIPQEKICSKCGKSKLLDEFAKKKSGKYGRQPHCRACKSVYGHAYSANNREKLKAYNAARVAKPKRVLEVKTCRKCQIEKPIDAFGLDKGTNDGHASRCKDCKNGESKTFRTNNPEQVRAASARWKAEHPEELAAYTLANKDKRSQQRKARYAANPEKENAQNKINYALNKDQWRPTRQAWETAHKDERRASHRKDYLARDPEERRIRDRAWSAANPEKMAAKNNRRTARKKNAPINDLTDAQWEEIKAAFDFRCSYCPDDCKQCKKKAHALTRDHVTPYTHNGSNTLWNVVPACLSCNSRKHAGAPLRPVQPLLISTAPARPVKKRGNKS